MTSRRAYALALVALAAGGIGLVVAYGLVWASADVPLLAGADGTGRRIELTGQALVPLGAAGGWLAVAAVAGIVATRGVGRRIVAAVAVLAGLAGVVGAVMFAARVGDAVTGVHAGATAITATPAWLLAALAGLVVVAAGMWAFARGRTWPVLGARYERRTPRADVSAWQAQDLGLDPTDESTG